jgi:hypothetical protein
MLVGYGTIKARRDAPDKEWRDDLALWRARVDEKLDNDNHSIKRFDRQLETNEEFQRIVLRSLKDILSNLSSGNHAEEMRQTNNEIDKFLIER